MLLDFHLDWLERSLVPLLDRNSLPELAQPIQDLHELLQCAVTL